MEAEMIAEALTITHRRRTGVTADEFPCFAIRSARRTFSLGAALLLAATRRRRADAG
jgi:hypothetical protein